MIMQGLPEQPCQTVILLKAADVEYKAGCHQDDTITIVSDAHGHPFHVINTIICAESGEPSQSFLHHCHHKRC